MDKIKLLITFILLGIIIYLVFWKKTSIKEHVADTPIDTPTDTAPTISDSAQQIIQNDSYINKQIPTYLKEKKFDPIHIAFILKSFNDALKESEIKRIPTFKESVKSYYDPDLAEKVYFKLRLANSVEQEEKSMIYAGLLTKLINTEGKIGTLDLNKDLRIRMFDTISNYITTEKPELSL